MKTLFLAYLVLSSGIVSADEGDFAAAPAPLVIVGTRNGKCTPLSPMVNRGRSVEFVLRSIDNRIFALDIPALALHLRAEPGKDASQVVTPLQSGDFPVVCGDEALPAKNRGFGSLMVM